MAKPEALTLGAVLIFTGGWGKSAMFPDAYMAPERTEGPTRSPPSSIARRWSSRASTSWPVFFPFFAERRHAHAHHDRGAFTAIFAAVIACTQKDIKRILAYSTLSQLGYMMFMLGACTISGTHAVNAIGYSASTFHIFNHAFFKCMLFLVAGSLIHQGARTTSTRWEDLGKKMRWTYWHAFRLPAISGIPPFSGFFSKDEIIKTAFENGHFVVFGVAPSRAASRRSICSACSSSPSTELRGSEGVAHAKEDPAMT